MIVGLTGGIACGKSSVSAAILKAGRSGVVVIDLDELARRVVAPGRSAYHKIVATFTEAILNRDGTIDRERLGQIIFADRAKRRELNAATHWPILWELVQEAAAARSAGAHIIFLDAPLLFETSLNLLCGATVVVHVKRATQLSRLQGRDHLDREECERRIDAQMPLASKMDRADLLIDNDGSREQTDPAIQMTLQRLETLASQCSFRRVLQAALLTPVLAVVGLLSGGH